MIRPFGDGETERIFNGERSKKLPYEMQNVARRKLRMIAAAKEITDLRIPPDNRLEKLLGDLVGFYSVQINDQWRIVFSFDNGGAENVRITDYRG